MVEGAKQTENNFQKITQFAEQLAAWDSRITEIFLLENGSDGPRVCEYKLICEFSPEPHSVQSGLISCFNLLIRDDEEGASKHLDLDIPIDLGFMREGNIYLPGGEIIQHNGVHSALYRRNDR